MHNTDRQRVHHAPSTTLGRVVLLSLVWIATMTGCATHAPPGPTTFNLLDTRPLRTGQFDQRGLGLSVHTYDGRGKVRSLSGWGDLQAVGMPPIDVYGLQFNVDGRVLSLTVRFEVSGTGRFAGPSGEVGFDEAFTWFPELADAVQIASAGQVTARVIGTSGSSPWFPLPEKGRAELRAWFDLPQPPSQNAPAR